MLKESENTTLTSCFAQKNQRRLLFRSQRSKRSIWVARAAGQETWGSPFPQLISQGTPN
jgi:hypothetical protein